MPVVTKYSYRKPARVANTVPMGPQPISMVGDGRESALTSFTEGQIK